MRKLVIGVLLFVIGQTLIWFQSNGQFVWPWFKKNIVPISILTGAFVSLTLVTATRNLYEYFGGLVWPGRFIGFSSGILLFAFFTWYFMGEGINTKTTISLILATLIICIQLFWK